MEEPIDQQSGGSSPLSSLASSPEPEPRPSKRPRLSSSPLIQQPLFLAQHRSPPVKHLNDAQHTQREDLNALLEGLEERDFDLPPSSDPRIGRERDGEADEQMEYDIPAVILGGKGKRSEADDSGIGLLPYDVGVNREEEETEGTGGERGRLIEPPDKTISNDEEEFEGDDMWLGFDDADMGFDQPDAFPSSVGSLAVAASRLTHPESKTQAQGESNVIETDSKEHEEEEEESKPADLEAFGFSSVLPTGGGFVFASRKALAPSAAALRRAQARFGDDPFASPAAFAPPARPSTAVPPLPPLETSTPQISHQSPSASAHNFLHPSSSSSSVSQILAPKPQRPRPAAPPSFSLGFSNGFGRSITGPSEEALLKARQIFEKSSSPESAPMPESKTKSRPPSNLPSRAPSRASSRSSKHDSDLFKSGIENQEPKSYSLQPLAPPVGDISQSHKDTFDSPTISRTRSFLAEEITSSTAVNGRRSPLAPMANGASLVSEDDVRSDHESSTTTLASSSPHKRETSPLPIQPQPESRPPLSPTSIGTTPSTAFPGLPFPSPSRPLQPRPVEPVKPVQPLASTSTPALVRRTAAFRPPMLNSARKGSPAPSSTPRHRTSLSLQASTIPIASTSTSLSSTPLFNRRLNIGMTPRNKPFHLANTLPSSSAGRKGKSTFVTPFKGGKRPDGLTPMGLKEQVELAKSKAIGSGSGSATAITSVSMTRSTMSQLGGASRKEKKAKVFDLTSGQTRFDLSNYGMRPQTHFVEELQSTGFPEAALSMTSENSSAFVFPCGRSAKTAFESLKALVASRSPDEEDLVTLPWVKNHWSLVVWKLACYVRTRPDLLDKWWKFEMVMDQLRYRYEREINQAQRSAIKRIQERDSPASLPMILCVSQLLWDDPEDSIDDNDGATQVIVGLELTDGWYRIRANIDKTLKSACERGKLIVGSKLAITGARLDKFRQEGIEVLEALGRSKLVITGNSTSLAPWNATLGFSQTPFFASLDSLSSAGGAVAPIDIVIERVYDLGYVDAMRTSSGTWGEAEEREKAEEWEKGRERIFARMQDAAEKEGHDEDDLVALLQEAVQGACEDGPSGRQESDADGDDPEEIVEKLGVASNKRAILRKLSPQSLQACLAVATERASRSRRQAYDDLKQELDQKYPPRQIRSVRMMRIRDAREGANGPFEREAILTVWDVKDYASDFFKEGKRYLVTNTIVKGSWQRKHKEIMLHTKKDSKWTKL
ncbi:hypothetical protein JCM3765_003665 [Sporobolomyces pararoseus]